MEFFLSLLPIAMGAAFGALLHRGRVTSCHVVADQFALRDNAPLKLLGSAIIVGGVGVTALVHLGAAHFMPKDANLLAVVLGAALFGIGMTVLGYCPGTAIAAAGTGSIHAAVGVAGMIAGAIAFALSYDWIATHLLPVLALGKLRLPDVTGIPDGVWFAILAAAAVMLMHFAEQRRTKQG